MSKLSFRARALDAAKPMPVYKSEEIPDLPDFAAINRAVPQMPTGMEKEEESVRFASLRKRALSMAAMMDLARNEKCQNLCVAGVARNISDRGPSDIYVSLRFLLFS